MYIVCLLLVLLWPGPPVFAQSAQPPLAFIHVTVIDGTGAPPRSDMSVIVTGDRITGLERTDRLKLPAGVRVVDATGKYLLPGLWDMHVHTHGRFYDPSVSFFPLLVANGVTGIRDMASPLDHVDQVRQWRRETNESWRPRIFAAGPLLDAAAQNALDSGANQIVNVTNENEARRAVRLLKRRGVDFVKVYNSLPRDAYFAIADEARKRKLPFVGHVPETIRVAEASDAGQRSIEHLSWILWACTPREAELRADWSAAKARGDAAALGRLYQAQRQTVLETYSDQKAAALFARFRKNHTWQCPTLTVLRLAAFGSDRSSENSQRLRYIPASVRERWEQIDYWRRSRTTEELASGKRLFDRQLQVVGAMHRAGVELLAGTDMLKPDLLPGFSLHDELALLVQAGLTPMEALQTATRNPARFLGLEKQLGIVRKGNTADLLLLDADPLADIRNTMRIHAVVLNGRLLDRAALDRMLADVEAAASVHSKAGGRVSRDVCSVAEQ
jgi:predicted amidohydrolase